MAVPYPQEESESFRYSEIAFERMCTVHESRALPSCRNFLSPNTIEISEKEEQVAGYEAEYELWSVEEPEKSSV